MIFVCYRLLWTFWFYTSHYYLISITITTINGRKKLFEIYSKFQTKTHKNIGNFPKILAFISMFFDIYKSRNDFNPFTIIALYMPGFYIINFIYTVIEMLEIATVEVQRKKTTKTYHNVYTAINNLNKTFGLSLFNYLLLSTTASLLFCYNHSLNFLHNKIVIITSTCYAQDVWCVILMIATHSLIRATHKLKVRTEQVKLTMMDTGCGDVDLWLINYEKIEIWAWGFFTIGNHIFISVIMRVCVFFLGICIKFVWVLGCRNDFNTRFSADSDGTVTTLNEMF